MMIQAAMAEKAGAAATEHSATRPPPVAAARGGCTIIAKRSDPGKVSMNSIYEDPCAMALHWHGQLPPHAPLPDYFSDHVDLRVVKGLESGAFDGKYHTPTTTQASRRH